MTRCRWAALTGVAASWVTAGSADACAVYDPPTLTDALHADAVVVGYVTKDVREGRLARDAWIERFFAGGAIPSPAERRDLSSAPARARLTVEVDHAIKGTTPSTITVYWYQKTNNGPPDPVNGGYVFALRRHAAASSQDAPGAYAVMQGVCAGALVFRRGDAEANAIREMFGLWPEPLEVPPRTMAQLGRDLLTQWPTLLAYALLAAGATIVGLVAFWPRRRRP